MKQTITTQQEFSRRLYTRLYGLLLLFLLSGLMDIQAQTVSWTATYPKLDPVTLTVLDDNPGYLDVYFIPTVASITNAKLEVTLPPGISYVGVENGTGHNASITYTPSFASQIVSVAFTSNGNTLKVGEAVFLRLKVSAACSAVNGATATVKVLSGSTVVTSGQKTVSIGVQTPIVRIQCDAPTQNYATQTETKEFELKLDAQYGEVSSLLLTLTGDQYAILSDFSLNGTTVTPTTLNVVSGNTSKTTITLNTTVMGGKLGSSVKKLKFKAESSRCGVKSITSSVQYPSESSCSTRDGVTLTMSFPAEAGLPNMAYVDSWLLTSDDMDAITSIWSIGIIPLDGVTPTYYRQAYTNNGTADAYDLKISQSMATNVLGYIDVNNIYYRIGTSGAVKKLDLDQILILGTKPATNSVFRIKSTNVGKPTNVTVSIPEVLPQGETIYIRWTIVQGAIYSNADYAGNLVSVYFSDRSFHGIYRGATANNRCGQAGGSVSTVYIGNWRDLPYFMNIPASINVKSGQNITRNISIRTGAAWPIELFVQLPEFLELDGGMSDGIKLGSATIASYIDHGNGKYSLVVTGGTISPLTLNLKSKACQNNTSNETGNVVCWMDYHSGDGTNPQRPVLQHISKVYIPATLMCKEDGVVMDEFYLTRKTFGYRDADDDGIPDIGGILATETDPGILHTKYLLNDKGTVTYKGRIVGTGSYKNFYCLLDVDILNIGPTGTAGVHLSVDNSDVKVKIGGVEYPATIGFISGAKRLYVHYSDPGGVVIAGGKDFEVNLDFTVKQGVDYEAKITAYSYVSDTDQTNPFSPQDRHGEDVMNSDIWPSSYSNVYYFDSGNSGITFNNNDPVSVGGEIRLGMMYSNFPYEYRPVYLPLEGTLTLPDGYELTNVVVTGGGLSSENVPFIRTGNTFVLNLEDYFDSNFNGSSPLTPGKLKLPEGAYTLYPTYTFRATKGASLGSSPVNEKTTYERFGNPGSMSQNFYFIYNGQSITLNLGATTTLSAVGPNLSLPVVSVGNPNNTALGETWLYVSGNVVPGSAFLSAVGGDGTPVISGEGFDGRWLKVSNSIASSGIVSYQLNFTYGGSNDCSVPDKIKIYTVADFDNSAWSPSTGSALDLTDYDHVGANKELSITAAPAAISGSVSISTSTLTFNTPYTLTAKLDSRGSEGSVKDARIEVTIPAGQLYTSGSARIEYPLGTPPVAVSSALETALLTANSNLGIDRTVTFASSALLPGYLAGGGVTDADRQMVFTAEYKPQCETVLTGIRYTGVLGGQTACGNVAKGNGSTVSSGQLYPTIVADYIFNVSSAMSGGNNAFNEKRTTGTLQVT
ncbi:MAG: hypothetical protein LBJ72_05985, partial [Dysgonamonadaceae bacterium]|nr:hypothetical protein [Dysgonamonadaceae bacterium]